MKNVLIFITVLIGLAAASFALHGLGLVNLKFWGVKYQDAHREIFEHSKSYNHGMIRDLENLCLQYEGLGSESHKSAIAATIRHRISAFDGELPSHVRKCLNSIN